QLTNACLIRCITGSVSTRFARGEQACLENCVNRFFDTSVLLVNRVEAQQAQ
ncbi:mitochondrial import inner membrane translocase subunit Tim8, partial [Clavulina sp. PMI_390]